MKLFAPLALWLLANHLPSTQFSAGPSLDAEIEAAISAKRIPGAVLVVGHAGKVVYRKAYGNRALEPQVEPMTLDTVFDCASLTKVIATTTCLMKLYEQGKFRLSDKITSYIPEFQGGKSEITIRNLMTHFSGLRPDISTRPAWSGYETGMQMVYRDVPTGLPGQKHVYSDINFELLGELVHRLSGRLISEYSREEIFKPMGMKDSMYNPPESLRIRIAPTEKPGPDQAPLRGVVHDPTARFMDGVAGHAGLFSTGDDLARFCQMMLNGGELGGKRFFGPLTIEKFTTPQTPTDQPILRGLGWDIDSPFSGNRGELFPVGSYGHTGFTGTSVWIDPTSKTYVILLTNAVHVPGGSVLALRAKVATIVAANLGVVNRRASVNGYNETVTNLGRNRMIDTHTPVQTGLDVLVADHFKILQGKRVGLITNPTGLDRQGKRNVDLMKAAGVHVTALFSPEHGWASAVDHAGIENTIDASTGIPVYSLYGKTLRPTPEMLKNVDTLVFDIQDVGVRFYTYETTMAYALEEAARAGIEFMVLDRPNPISGIRVEGPPLDEKHVSFVGYFAGMPVRHGMTMGELAMLFNGEKHLGAKLTVIKNAGLNPVTWFDYTNLPWTNPSPNMRSLNAAAIYPGLCLMEFPKNFSVGRGTDAPFEQFGADFINGPELSDYLNRRQIPGVRFYPTSFKPTEAKFKDVLISGVRIIITDRDRLDPTRMGIELAVAVQKLYPGKVDFNGGGRLIGNDDVIQRIIAAEEPTRIMDSYREQIEAFRKVREKYLLYGNDDSKR